MSAVIRSTAMAIGAQPVATVLAGGGGSGGHGGTGGHGLPTAAAYQTAFLYVAGTASISLLICQMLPKRLPEAEHPAH